MRRASGAMGTANRTRLLPGLLASAALGLLTSSALAAGCPGNPSALGTSRTLVVDPREHPRIGTMQYAETLPLADKEVVLTFDDGPLPKYSNQVLEILAAECIKATFFVVGIMAQEHPDGVRRLRDAGHTIGTHTQHHPLGMRHMANDAARTEIDDGIAAATAALGGEAPAPFFRIPGLSRAEATEDHAAALGLQVWSADFPADDWRHISSARVHDLAMSRIEAKGKGILLLHDIQARTVAALPGILRDLKAGGYRIVHVVPATKDLPKTPTEPQQWQMYPVSEHVAIARWPAVPGFAFARSEMLPIPAAPQLGVIDGALMLFPERFNRVKRLARGHAPLPLDGPWPSFRTSATAPTAASLPVPAAGVFALAETTGVPNKAMTPITRPVGTPESVTAPGDSGRLIESSTARQAIPGSVLPKKSELQPVDRPH